MKYLLVDFMHLAHRCVVMEPLTSTLKINGELKEVDTTIPYYTTKTIGRYARDIDGRFMNVGVCFEGGTNFRKTYFNKHSKNEMGYKENRHTFYPLVEGAKMTKELLKKGDINVYSAKGYEADDAIYTVIEAIKTQDPEYDIRVVTNDSDLLPLVDDRVTIYMRGTRQHSEAGFPEYRMYYQVTPQNWEEYLSMTSAFKGYKLPYTSIILFKLIKGDKADNIKGACKGYGPKKFTQLTEQMIADGVDFAKIFRYQNDFSVMKPILEKYFTPEEVEHMEYIYGGMQLKFVVPKETLPSITLPKPINFVKIGDAGLEYGIETFYRI